MDYKTLYNESITNKEEFWKKQAERIVWDKEPTQILDSSNPPFYRWFKGGKLNVCYNLVDRHVEGEHPETIDATQIESRVEQIYQNAALKLLGEKEIPLKEGEQIIFKDEQKPFHSNAIVFKVLDDNTQILLEKTYYSTGGGFVVEDTQLNKKGELVETTEAKKIPCPFLSAEKLLQYSHEKKC